MLVERASRGTRPNAHKSHDFVLCDLPHVGLRCSGPPCAGPTVAVAYRRASTAYLGDDEMQQLGTAAVHLLTMATSYMAARSEETTHI